MAKKSKYGKPVSKDEILKPRRLPQYDECLREFLNSGFDYWEVNNQALPSKDIKVILSSLKWRIRKKEEFRNKIRIFTRKNHIYLERVKK